MPPLPECPRCQGQIAPRRDHNTGSDYLICITCGHEPGTAAALTESQDQGTTTENDFANAVALAQRKRRKEYETNITELARIRWPQGIVCPRCRQPGPRFNPNPDTYQPLLCPHCNLQFSPRNGTFINDNTQTKAWLSLLQHTVKRRELPSASATAEITGYRNREIIARMLRMLQQAVADSKVDLSQGTPAENATRIINAPAPTPARFKTKPKPPPSLAASIPAAKTATPGEGRNLEIPEPGPAIGKLTRIQSLDLIAAIRWPREVSCLSCSSTNLGYQQTERFWRCRECARRFSAQTDTLFAKHNNLAKWVYVLTSIHHWQRLPLPAEISAALNISHDAANRCINLIRENLTASENPHCPETIRRTMFNPNQPATVDHNASVAATLDAPTTATAKLTENAAEPATPEYRQFCQQVYQGCSRLKDALSTIYDENPPSRWDGLTRQAVASSLQELNPSSLTVAEINHALMRQSYAKQDAGKIYRIIMEQLAQTRNCNQAAYPTALNLLYVSETISQDLNQARQHTSGNNQHRMTHLICQDRLGDNIVDSTDPAIGKLSQALTKYRNGAGKYETFNALIQVLAQK